MADIDVTSAAVIEAIADGIVGNAEALADLSGAIGGALGAGRLYGPYVVDFGDVPNDGDAKTLFTPTVGDVCLHAFPIPVPGAHLTGWDAGNLIVGQHPTGSVAHNSDTWCAIAASDGYVADSHNDSGFDHGVNVPPIADAGVSAIPIVTADPVIAKWFQKPQHSFDVAISGDADGGYITLVVD